MLRTMRKAGREVDGYNEHYHHLFTLSPLQKHSRGSGIRCVCCATHKAKLNSSMFTTQCPCIAPTVLVDYKAIDYVCSGEIMLF